MKPIMPMTNDELQEWIISSAEKLEGDDLRAVGTFIRTNNDIAGFFNDNPNIKQAFIDHAESKK